MARYYHRLPSLGGAWSATSAAAGYPVTHLDLPSVLRPWRSANLSAQTLTLDFGGLQQVSGVIVMGTNIPSGVQLEVSNDGFDFDPVGGPQTPVRALHSLRKLVWDVGTQDIEILRLQISGSAGGASHFEVGYVLVFEDRVTLRRPLYGADVRIVRPRWSADLPSGRTVSSAAGPTHTEVRLPWRQGGAEEDIEQLAARALEGPVLLDLQAADRSGWYWPVRSHEDRIDRQLTRFNREQTTLTLREIV